MKNFIQVDIQEFDGFPVTDQNGITQTFISEVVLTPKTHRVHYHVPRGWEQNIRQMKELASKEIATIILNRMEFHVDYDSMSGQTIAIFNLNDCSITQSEMYEQKISSLKTLLERERRTIYDLRKEIKQYENEGIFHFIKRKFNKFVEKRKNHARK